MYFGRLAHKQKRRNKKRKKKNRRKKKQVKNCVSIVRLYLCKTI